MKFPHTREALKEFNRREGQRVISWSRAVGKKEVADCREADAHDLRAVCRAYFCDTYHVNRPEDCMTLTLQEIIRGMGTRPNKRKLTLKDMELLK